MENIRNTILLFFILLFFILLIYFYNMNTINGAKLPLQTKESFASSSLRETIGPVDTITNSESISDTSAKIKEGSAYLKPWYKRSCSCAEGFETSSSSSSSATFQFYKYNKESKNSNYQPKGSMELESVEIHPQTKMFYYHFSYRLKEFMNITDKVILEPTKGTSICFWLRIHNLYYNSDTMTILSLNLGGVNNIRIAVNSAGLYLTLNHDTGYYIHNFRELGTNNNTWNHIAWTMSPENTKDWNVYYNGVHHKTIQNQNTPASVIPSNDPIQVIGTDTAYNEFLEGYLGDLRIVNTVLDMNQIKDIYNQPTVINNVLSNNNLFPTANNENSHEVEFNSYPGKTWWGNGTILEENKVSNQKDCEDMCSRRPHCSGATYNPDKQYCWATKGDSQLTPGLSSDYALVPTGTMILP